MLVGVFLQVQLWSAVAEINFAIFENIFGHM